MNDNYDNTQPGTDVTERGETIADEPAYTGYAPAPHRPDFTRTPKEFFWTRDIYQATTLAVYGIPFVRAQRAHDGRIEWVFRNENDAAWRLSSEFRNDPNLMVPIRAFRETFKRMAMAADEARREGTAHYDNNSAA